MVHAGVFLLALHALALAACARQPDVVRPEVPRVVENPRSRLTTLELGRAGAIVVLLHGYGSSPQEWLPVIAPLVAHGGRFVLPRGPEASESSSGAAAGAPARGRAGRGWWRLRLDQHTGPSGAPDLSDAHPAGLVRAAGELRALLVDVGERAPGAPLVLGGFSQGAMVAAEAAWRGNRPVRAVVLLSGTLVDEPGWAAALARHRGLPVFIAHGRHDRVLPFAAAERLVARMRATGLAVTFVPFDGGHEIPPVVIEALARFLATVAGPQRQMPATASIAQPR